MNKLLLTLAAGLFVFTACGDDADAGATSTLLPPSDIKAERTGADDVLVTWKDNSTSETGFAIVVRNASTTDAEEVAQVGADVTSYTISGILEEGNAYYIGVRAFDKKTQTRVISVLFDMQVLADAPQVSAAVNSDECCIWSTYTISNTTISSGDEWGLCWSDDGIPTLDDDHMAGPQPDASGKVFQVIPVSELDYGTTYKVRAYYKNPLGVQYSAVQEASMTKEYPAITLDWKKIDGNGIPSSIEVYETTSKLNGSNFHAWYAIADCSRGDIEFRVNVPSSAQTIDTQAASFGDKCCILVNGGYFYNGRNTGLAVVDGTPSGSVGQVRGSLNSSDAEYNEMYYVTRGCFGVDASGKPAAFWAGADDTGKPLYYDTPLASVVGENKYGCPSAKLPVEPENWKPKFAQSAGPLLLIDGKIPFSYTTTPKGGSNYLTNYEVIPYDIFPPTVSPDRTAAGYTEDGKIILFICDGRIASSDGATILELAQIMKGLGCVGAVNFDGGGSTGMMVGNKHINDQTPNNRPVVSTLGFFKK